MNVETFIKKNRWQSFWITVGVFIVLFLLSWFIVVLRGTIPPEDENPYITVGRIDFGDAIAGSGTQNTWQPSGVAQPTQETASEAEDLITSETPSEVSAGDASEQATEEETIDPEALFEPGEEQGTSQGEEDLIGNRGNPLSPVLDPKGLFQFGEGEYGLQGRIPLALPEPSYQVDKETRVTYEFSIAPDGRVIHVKPLTLTTAPELIQAGKEAIYQWRFNAIKEDKIQKARVTITFKLR